MVGNLAIYGQFSSLNLNTPPLEGGPCERDDVYGVLAEHQRTEEWWLRAIITVLQCWAELFNSQFNLGIPELVIGADRLDRRRLGQFRYGHNGLGLKGEVIINVRHIRRLVAEPELLLMVLLHEQLHAWQQAHGKPGAGNFHNGQYRSKAKDLGLTVDDRGATEIDGRGRFRDLLQQHGVQFPDLPQEKKREERATETKMKKWTCQCAPPVSLRVGRERVNVMCLDCGFKFTRTE